VLLSEQALQLAAQELSTAQKCFVLLSAKQVAAVYATHVLSVALVWAPASVKPVQALQSAAQELSTAQKCFVPFSAQQVAAVYATHVLSLPLQARFAGSSVLPAQLLQSLTHVLVTSQK
jgi:hypothetical protein